MKVLAAVCCYNRAHLLAHWFRLWPGVRPPVELVAVHPYDGEPDRDVWNVGCGHAMTAYHRMFSRPNVGADIGSFKYLVHPPSEMDVPTGWDVLCWFTDDCLPMRKDFLKYFVDPFADPKVGLVAFGWEPKTTTNMNPHARTVAFAVRRDVALRLRFPYRLDQARAGDRQPCFEFEHGRDNMYLQVVGMGYKAVPCRGAGFDPRTHEPLPGYHHWVNQQHDFMWDSGHCPGLDLWDRFKEVHGL